MQKNFKAFTKTRTSTHNQDGTPRDRHPMAFVKAHERNSLFHQQLDWFVEHAAKGYTDYGFAVMTDDFNRLSKSLTLPEYHALGEAWRNCYTASSKQDAAAALQLVVDEIKTYRPLSNEV